MGLLLVFRTEEVFRFLGMGKYNDERMTPTQIRAYQIIGIVLVLGGLQTLAGEIFDFYFK